MTATPEAGSVWLITGCSTGFGREIALALHQGQAHQRLQRRQVNLSFRLQVLVIQFYCGFRHV